MPKTFYVTTPIYYVNGKPSIGHAYTAIAADILARYHRMLGEDVLFQTGTDENSQKNIEAARAAGKEDDVQGYLNEMAALWQRTFDSLGLTHTRFIRTTEADHLAAVKAFWKAVEAKGDIYQGTYEGLYCQGCEAFVTEADLVNRECPLHKKPPLQLKEKNYFFRLTRYQDALLEHIGKHPKFIQPESRRNEVLSYIRNFFSDVSISRETMKWGIQVPTDPSQRIYVWFDALINYISGVGYGTDEKQFNTWWPAQVHLVGKDIIKFHCALWPAMLMSAGLPLPETVFANGFWTVDGQKMSKSLGNVVDPVEMAEQYGNDPLRYFLMREIPFGSDGDFSEARLAGRYDGDLANEFGNLVHRVLSMTEKYTDSTVPERADGFLTGVWPAYHLAMQECRLHDALEIAWNVVRQTNQFVDQQQPWTLAKMEEKKMLHETLYILLETLRHLAWMLFPFLPSASERLFEQLGLAVPKEFSQSFESAWVWGEMQPGSKIKKGEPLFPRREPSI
ncbi:MAG: Methionine-tRNA ligase [Candidatus Uhrbacteria bacterium GW2011_GWF2_41_16]|uniref:Methionine--tRNA ligase n=2 Tax=Candidatus Uhriibacteriota TaxID=1752732 RepID=A0A0G0XKW6_9BACT|nr:MAG: Methionine-tRNA ligase [Candidatus Uhrbacteria bacterium GW2011_GWC2_41_11]KKR97415.1 MAG: Methionine-tRNA ligase [Candidatus Uhrbacteria bacterium GW2011_GWF2_41_16]